MKRPLRTVPLLEAALKECTVIRTRRCNVKNPVLQSALIDRTPYVLFPSDDAVPTDQLPTNAAIIAIDGTWRQARGMLHNSSWLQSLPHCRVASLPTTEYVIRTQPEEGFVSTLEALAAAVAGAEQRAELYGMLTSKLVL